MRLLLFLIVTFSHFSLLAQYGEQIRSGRPGQSIGAFTVGTYVLQVQSGVTLDWADWDQAESNGFASTTVIRYGVKEHFEISGVLGFARNEQEVQDLVTKANGINNLQLGFRYNLRDGQGSGPNIGIQTRFKLNFTSNDFPQKNLGTTTILALTQGLGGPFGMATNLGITWNGNQPDPIGFYTLNLGASLGQGWEVFIENYGNLQSSDLDTRFDTGVGYIVSPNLKLDFSAGWGKNEGISDYFIDFGFSWRTLVKPRS